MNTTTLRHGPLWIAGVAAVLLGALAVGVLVFANPLSRNQHPGTPAGGVAAATTPSADPQASPSATAEPIDETPVANVAPFSCTAATLAAASAPAVAAVDAIRTGTHAGYDRVTVEFAGAQARSIQIRPQAGVQFTGSPRGDTVTLAGRHGILVVLQGADAHTAYSGSRDLKTAYPGLAEARVIEDFEGQVQLGLGTWGSGCYRASILANPVRLVLDIQTS
jgi:hypothetical protein